MADNDAPVSPGLPGPSTSKDSVIHKSDLLAWGNTFKSDLMDQLKQLLHSEKGNEQVGQLKYVLLPTGRPFSNNNGNDFK